MLNHNNPSLLLLPFDWARHEPGPGNHQRGDMTVGESIVLIAHVYKYDTIDHPNDHWDMNVIYLMINDHRVRRSTRTNTEQEPLCRCLTCLFPLCYYHHNPFHDIDNEEANLRGPRKEYDNGDEE